MSFLPHIRRFCVKARIVLLVPQVLDSFALEFVHSSPALPIRLSRAFHQTVIKSCHTFSQNFYQLSFPHSQNRNFYEKFAFDEHTEEKKPNTEMGFEGFVELVNKAENFASGDEALAFLDESGAKPNQYMIYSVIWALRYQWKLAFLVFKWGQRWDCVFEKTWCLLIWVLGNHKKFGIAWSLIRDLHRGAMDIQEAMFTMIDRYAAGNYPGKAIETFQLMEKFRLSPHLEAFHTCLKILCRNGFIEEAEEFMFLSERKWSTRYWGSCTNNT